MLEEGYKRHVLYTYSIGHLPQKDKVLFFYAIKGRNSKPGLIAELGINQLGRCVLLVPLAADQPVEEFLKKWNCAYTKRNVLVNYREETESQEGNVNGSNA